MIVYKPVQLELSFPVSAIFCRTTFIKATPSVLGFYEVGLQVDLYKRGVFNEIIGSVKILDENRSFQDAHFLLDLRRTVSDSRLQVFIRGEEGSFLGSGSVQMEGKELPRNRYGYFSFLEQSVTANLTQEVVIGAMILGESENVELCTLEQVSDNLGQYEEVFLVKAFFKSV